MIIMTAMEFHILGNELGVWGTGPVPPQHCWHGAGNSRWIIPAALLQSLPLSPQLADLQAWPSLGPQPGATCSEP